MCWLELGLCLSFGKGSSKCTVQKSHTMNSHGMAFLNRVTQLIDIAEFAEVLVFSEKN